MVFTSPSWTPQLPFELPDSITISEFLLNEAYGRFPLALSKAPFTCGISGKAYSAIDVKDRVECLARGLSERLGWQPNEGSEWDKVVGIFSPNTVSERCIVWFAGSHADVIRSTP